MSLTRALADARLRRTLPSPAMRKKLRMAAGVSQQAIATAVGASASAVSRWEAGSRCPRDGRLRAYARLLGQLADIAPAANRGSRGSNLNRRGSAARPSLESRAVRGGRRETG